MKRAAAFGITALFALASCDEGAGTSSAAGQAASASAGAKKAGQVCALTVAQCQSFSAQSQALLPVLNKPAKGRSANDDKTVQLVLDTLLSQQAAADRNCIQAKGALTRQARMESKSGQTAILMGDGGSVCTLIRPN